PFADGVTFDAALTLPNKRGLQALNVFFTTRDSVSLSSIPQIIFPILPGPVVFKNNSWAVTYTFEYAIQQNAKDPRKKWGAFGYIGISDGDPNKELGVEDNTLVIFSGDNGPEEIQPWRGTAGFFDGSYFTGMEGSLRTPCLVRYPGRVPAGRQSNDVVHITDMFTTLVRWGGGEIPNDRVIDGVDQRPFFEGKRETSARDRFPYWMGGT